MLSKKYSKQILSPVFGVISTLFLLVTIMGCNKEIGVIDALEVDNLNPVVRSAGGTISLNIASNASWKVGNIDADWLYIDNAEGTGDGQLHLSCDENATVDSRTVEFFVVTTKDGVYHKITLTQLATDPILTLDEHELEVGSRPRSHDIKLTTNIPVAAISVEIVYEQEEGDNWIVGVNVGAESLRFQTTLNTLSVARTATVILTYEDATGEGTDVWDKITVTQMASGNEPPPEVVDLSYAKGLPLGEIVENISVIGNVVSNGTSDNFRHNTYILQNGNGVALAFESVDNLTLNKFDKIQLLLDGAQLETFEDNGAQYRIIRGVTTANILSQEADASFVPPTVRISELTDDHLLSLVTLPDVEFAMPHGGYTNFHEFYLLPAQSYADHATVHYPAPIRDINGDDLYLITNREVAYRRNSVPKGAGKITGVVVKITNSEWGQLGEYSIRHLAEADIVLDPNRANGFSEILVEWEFPDHTALQATLPAANTAPGNPGRPFLAPTVPTAGSLASATLKKDESTGIYAGYTAIGGTYLIDKYRGDKPMAGNSIITRGGYNVNRWGAGKYWIIDNVSTLGITSSLSLQFEANSVAVTGPRDFAIEYSLDGDNWTRIATYQVLGQMTTGANDRTYAVPGYKVFTYSLPDELLNKPNIKIRLMNINNTSVNGENINTTSSTSRLAYFSIKYNK